MPIRMTQQRGINRTLTVSRRKSPVMSVQEEATSRRLAWCALHITRSTKPTRFSLGVSAPLPGFMSTIDHVGSWSLLSDAGQRKITFSSYTNAFFTSEAKIISYLGKPLALKTKRSALPDPFRS